MSLPTLRPPPWLTRDLRLLIAGRGLRSLTQAYLTVIVPLYLAHLGYGAMRLGLIFTAASVTSTVLMLLVGFLSDVYGRKPFLILLALLTSLGGLVFATSGNFIFLLLAGGVSTIGRGGAPGSGGAWGPYYPAEQALIAEQVDDVHRTAALGLVSLIGVLTGALGSLVAATPDVLHAALGISVLLGDRLLFGVTVVLGIATAIVVVPVRERRQAPPARQPAPLPGVRRPREAPSVLHQPLPRRNSHQGQDSTLPSPTEIIVRFMLTNSLTGLAVGLIGPILVYWFYRRYSVGESQIGALYFLANLFAAPSYAYADRLSRRLGPVRSVVVTRLLSGAFLALLPLMPTFSLAGALYLVRRIVSTVSVPIRQSYLMGAVPPPERGRAAGLTSLPVNVLSSAGPTISGYLMETVSIDLPLELAAVLIALNAILYGIFFHRLPPEGLMNAQDVTES